MALQNLSKSLEYTASFKAVPVVAQELVKTNEEALVLLKETFKDAPVMVRIAECESGSIDKDIVRHWDENGEVLRGKINPLDRGAFQINEAFHLETSQKLGYDIHTAEGNIGYAKYLYKKNGTKDWIASSECWK